MKITLTPANEYKGWAIAYKIGEAYPWKAQKNGATIHCATDTELFQAIDDGGSNEK